MKPPSSGKGSRYHWIIAAACFVMIFVGLGFCSSNKSMYLVAITDALGLRRSLFCLNDSFRYVTTAVVNLFFGSLVMRFGAKRLVGVGMALLAASVTVNLFATALWQFYLAGCLLGAGMSFCTTTMVSYLVSRWMPEKRGTFTGAILCANGIGGAVAAQLISPLINDPANAFGYRKAYTLALVLTVAAGILVTLLIREPPAPAIATTDKKQKGRQWSGITLQQALRTPYFYAAAGCVLLTGMALQGIHGIAAAHMYDVGLPPEYVAIVLSLSSLILAGSKFLVGLSYDKLGLSVTVTICDLCGCAAFLCLAFAGIPGGGKLLSMGYGVLSSLALPLETVLVPLIAADLFGEKDFARLLGIFVSVNTAGFALGAPVANLSFELTGSYTPILILSGSLMAVITVVFQLILRSAKKARKTSV